MSIIHEALKKVQQGSTPETEKTRSIPSTVTETASAYLYETPAKAETPPLIKNKIKSILVLSSAIAVTAASILYIYQQFQNDIPKVDNLAKKSFYKSIHQEAPPALKTTASGDLKALARFTINQTAPPVAGPAGPKITTPPAPLTLNIQGIMSQDTGNLVLINDRVYQQGDEVDGAKIAKINPDSVTVNINGTEKTIFVKND